MSLKISPDPSKIYLLLLKRFGPQGWWPVTPSQTSKPKYHPGRFPKLTPQQAFEIAIGAILTQNTAWPNVEKALGHLHQARVVHPAKLLEARSSLLAKWIRPSGYFRQKTKKLKVLAHFVQTEAGGNLLNLRSEPVEALRRRLLALWGVGPETADSILLYALGQPVFVVDAYTRRIGERLGWPFAKKSYEDIRMFFESHLSPDVFLFQEYHALLVRLAKENCAKKNPLCLSCPLGRHCAFARLRR